MYKTAINILPLIQKNSFCKLHTSILLNGSYTCKKLQFYRQKKMLHKLMDRASGGSKKMSPAPNIKTLSKTEGEDGRSGRKRVSVLNKLFMRHVTDLMTTGEIAELVKGKQLEISQVKIAPNFNMVYVLWLSRGDPLETELEKLLVKVAGMLRHDLSQLKVIGVVPAIQFVKDTQYAKLVEVDRALAKADFGEDFVPSTQTFHKLQSDIVLNTKLKPEVVEKIKELEKDCDEELIEEPMPPMRHDVFGLDRSKMLNRLQYVINKPSEVRWSLEDMAGEPAISPQQDKLRYTNFINEREFTRRKLERIQKQRSQIETVPKEIYELERKKYFTDSDMTYEEFDHSPDDLDDKFDDFTPR